VGVWCMSFPIGCKMTSTRTKIGKILLPVLVSPLLIGIVSSEFPELLSLTITANDHLLGLAREATGHDSHKRKTLKEDTYGKRICTHEKLTITNSG
jgi:hypothetical protein